MARAYYSTTFNATADKVWQTIQDFNEDTWSGDVTKSWRENNVPGTAVGNIRVIEVGDKQLRQRLVAYSDTDRWYTYEFAGKPSMQVEHFQATIHVLPITEGDRSFVEWYASYDCSADEMQHSHDYFVQGCARWLANLRKKL
ncbi:MAG TPA: SRPBCC family protein [Polyangiaceae bacterium]|nr:SRPBCC family protein [Polyangiaceae bacterium]